ncbi:MAG: hypothetical protein PVI90_10620 [Desulfobacteraceae bacterium]|jgi:hypothetical protein
MQNQVVDFKEKIESLVAQWKFSGVPSRATLEEIGTKLLAERRAKRSTGLWNSPPLMITATLDDGLGQGLMIIHQFAEAVGMRIRPLGLIQSVDHIIADCKKMEPDFLGLTILQFDSEEDLTTIACNLPQKTRIICGGPVFQADLDLAERCGVHYVARHVGVFLEILLMHSKNC